MAEKADLDRYDERVDVEEGELHCLTDTVHETECSDIFPNTENMTFSVPKRRRHSTGSFIADAELTCCKYEDHKTDDYNKVHTLSRQFSHENFIQNIEAIKCSRFHSRRNALCDPFRMLIPQHLREHLENNFERRKTSVTRKVSQFITVSLDLNREEELI